jgi:hypothetical protein
MLIGSDHDTARTPGRSGRPADAGQADLDEWLAANGVRHMAQGLAVQPPDRPRVPPARPSRAPAVPQEVDFDGQQREPRASAAV